jgi:hypothetical protein
MNIFDYRVLPAVFFGVGCPANIQEG